MDQHVESPEPQPGRRSFVLTPAAPRGEKPAGSTKSRRMLLIGGTVAIPFLTSIAGEPALAWKKTKKKKKTTMSGGGYSYHPSIYKTKKKKTSKKTKKKKSYNQFERGGDTVAMWQQKYPQLLQNSSAEAAVFPAKATAHRYLANPLLASVFVVPRQTVNGIAIAPPAGDLHGALHGRATWSVSLTHNGETVHRQMDGAFFAEATAAVLNGAAYGEHGFGLHDGMVVDQVHSALRNLQSRALALRQAHPDWEAARLLDAVAKHITGGSALDPRGETYYLAQLNSGGMNA
jgi:hypothetical protein